MSSIPWMHCNKCFSQKGDQFFLTQCGHILCPYCAQRSREMKACPVCKDPNSHLMPLDKNTPSYIADYFKPDFMSQLSQVMEFQNKQYDSYLTYQKEKYENNQKECKRLKQALDAEKQEYEHLMHKLKVLKMQDEAAAYPPPAGFPRMANDTSASTQTTSNFTFRPPYPARNQGAMDETALSSLVSDGRQSKGSVNENRNVGTSVKQRHSIKKFF